MTTGSHGAEMCADISLVQADEPSVTAPGAIASQPRSQSARSGLTPGAACGLDLIGSSPCGRGSSVVFVMNVNESVFSF